jgi:exodeoxyribonuclease V alpha subunit
MPPVPRSQSEDDTLSLTDEQYRGICELSAAKVGILTGGPGVGKTTVLKALVQHFKANGQSVALASPTGRAARRMKEATGEDAQTLHRLFGLAPNLKNSGELRTVEADLLVIDEASMLDLPVFVQVLRRVSDRTRLILVGDPEQLPSIGPGSVLKDLLLSRRFVTVRLKQVFRQAAESDIIMGAHSILSGRVPRFRSKGDDGDAFFVESSDTQSAAALISHLVTDRIPKRFGLDTHREIQVLSPRHRGLVGVEHLNALIQSNLHGGKVPLKFGEKSFYEGDRVIQKRNDYDRDVMNGELGFVAHCFPDAQSLSVVFDGKDPLTYGGKQLQDLDPAFALTVHKSQGAEFPAVILALFPEHQLMLRRSVLYTAVTRAQRLLVVVGTRSALSSAVNDIRTQDRQGVFFDLLCKRELKHEIPDF